VADREDVVAVIDRVLRDEVGLQRAVRPEDNLLTDLQLDSVGLLTLVVGLEDHYRIALAEQDAAAVQTVGDLASLVAARVEPR
jgi:acyl carrier protein